MAFCFSLPCQEDCRVSVTLPLMEQCMTQDAEYLAGSGCVSATPHRPSSTACSMGVLPRKSWAWPLSSSEVQPTQVSPCSSSCCMSLMCSCIFTVSSMKTASFPVLSVMRKLHDIHEEPPRSCQLKGDVTFLRNKIKSSMNCQVSWPSSFTSGVSYLDDIFLGGHENLHQVRSLIAAKKLVRMWSEHLLIPIPFLICFSSLSVDIQNKPRWHRIHPDLIASITQFMELAGWHHDTCPSPLLQCPCFLGNATVDMSLCITLWKKVPSTDTLISFMIQQWGFFFFWIHWD